MIRSRRPVPGIPIAILFALILMNLAFAGDSDRLFTRLESGIPAIMEKAHVPGLSMVLIRDRRIVWTGAFGVRSAGSPERVDAYTVFEAASMSKPLFSYAALKLVEEGRFDPDRPLDAYLPEPYLPGEPRAKTITGRRVMLHRTGLPNWRKGGWRSDAPLKLVCDPDTRFTYSGEGYLYLQTAVEALTGEKLDPWIRRRLLDPLKMTRSGYTWRDDLAADFAGGHDKQGNLKKNRRFYDRGNAAFSLYTTPTDYARFLIEMMDPDRSAKHALGSAMVEAMTTLQVLPEPGNDRTRRSLGFVTDSRERGGWVCHSGSNGTGFRCHARFHMDTGAGSVIMTNADGGVKAWEDILALIDEIDPAASGAAREGALWGPAKRTVRYDYRIMNPTAKPITDIEVNLPLPLASPRQEIEYLHLPGSYVHRRYMDRHGQDLVRYEIDRLEPGEYRDLGFVAGVTLRNRRWAIPGPAPRPDATELSAEARARYLRAETNYSMDTELMRSTAASLVRGAKTDYEKLVRIHDHVIGKIRYVRDGQWDPAAEVLARGTGSCSEYNYVLSGLCRLAGLPTRCVGGTIDGFRTLPTTDTVFHRWTEIFLDEYGWFPADCSRDANPLRGTRSHFGRVHRDALVWCRQAGGEDDTLGWDYRAHARVRGEGSGLRENHRVRWFAPLSGQAILDARTWFLDRKGERPEPDELECAELWWAEGDDQDRLALVSALAEAGRNACLRRAATLPEEGGLREKTIEKLCASENLAEALLKASRNLNDLRNWFRSRESRLVPSDDGRFELTSRTGSTKPTVTAAPSAKTWADLAIEVADRMVKILDASCLEKGAGALVLMPVTDQTGPGLGGRESEIHSVLKRRFEEILPGELMDEGRFDLAMAARGPGRGAYWTLATGEDHGLPEGLRPEAILVPVAITEPGDDGVIYHLEIKGLEVKTLKYVKAVARVERRHPGETASTDEPGTGVLVAGGDTVLARWEHDLVSRNGIDWPLAGVKRVLASADLALCNLECCVTRRGAPRDKDERCSFYYRARPEMLASLTGAGIDLVTAANNHGGDYGPVSAADTRAWCERAGLACAGVGPSPAEAERPVIVPVGSLLVGVAGLDTTSPRFVATDGNPGSSFAPEDGPDLAAFTEKMKRLGRWAEGRCDLLILTPHWGSNWVRETPPVHREMARIAFAQGVDLILGHSAHRLQGVEIIDGKPVVYDMGNLLFDCDLKPEGKRSAIFRVRLSKEGVRAIEIVPVQALNGHTVLARHHEAEATLTEMQDLCAALGTELLVDEDLEGRPMGVIRIEAPKRTQRSEPDPGAPPAGPFRTKAAIAFDPDAFSFPDALPADATALDPPAAFTPGLALLGYRLPPRAEEGGILRIVTWWRVTGDAGANRLLAYHLKPHTGDTPRRGTPWYTRHDGADWAVPLAGLPGGKILEDDYPARLAGLPPGPCDVYALVLDTTRSEGERVLGEPRRIGTVEIRPREKADH